MKTTLFILLGLFWNISAHAEIVQILHTNDTHSFLDHSTHNKDRGGFLRLKNLINHFRQEMDEKGIKTITVDAGDFLEGNIYFMADQGLRSMQAYNSIGYDFSVIGNHDYQIGIKELDRLFGQAPLSATTLCANMNVSSYYKNLHSAIKPYKEIKIGDAKVAFLGLTTDELVYRWQLPKDTLKDPIKVGKDYDQILKDRGNNFIIALTHIGFKQDKKLASKTKYIDLIIGGHSHTVLKRPTLIENKKDRLIPIVQTGAHTEYLGRLIVDITKGKNLKVISYELVPVYEATNVFDPDLERVIDEADESLENNYGKDWLNEIIGYSELKPDDEEGDQKWAFFISDALKKATHADIAIHSPEMNGDNYPIGHVNRRMIFNSIPRVFSFDDKYGWDIYSVTVRGSWISYFIRLVAFLGDPLAISGVSGKIEYTKNERGLIKDIRINGAKLKLYKNYKIVFTEGIIKGAAGITKISFDILKNPQRTGKKVWGSIEEALKEYKISAKKVDEGNHLYID